MDGPGPSRGNDLQEGGVSREEEDRGRREGKERQGRSDPDGRRTTEEDGVREGRHR